MVGSSNLMKANVVGNFPGTICNKCGGAIRKGIMQNVTHCPSMQCNIFSLTKMMLQGWDLGGNKESIWLKKGKDKILFDIKLITQKGIIFCIYFKRTLSGNEISVGDCYQMWNPITNKVYESREVVFLQGMFYVKPDGPFSATVRMIPEVEGTGNTDDNEDDLDEE